MRIDGVICDLDGTIVDSEGVHTDAWNDLVRHYGYEPPDAHWHDDCIGLPDSVARDKTIRLFPDLIRHKDDIVRMKEEIFRALVVRKGRGLAYPGVHENLVRLRDKGIALAVGTNSVFLNCTTTLNAAELAQFFPVVVTIDQVANGKPSPDIYRTAAERMGLDPAHCAVVEDSVAGLQAARAAGCQAIGVTTTWTADKLVPSDKVFSDTASALAWIAESSGDNHD